MFPGEHIGRLYFLYQHAGVPQSLARQAAEDEGWKFPRRSRSCRREFVIRKGSAPGTARRMSAERTVAPPRPIPSPGLRASRGSVQYREGARTGQIRERRENGKADGQRILRGDDLVAHEATQGVG